MKRFWLVVALLAAALVPARADWSLADMNRTVDETNFQVNDSCSGTLISAKERLVLTANHCVEDQYQVFERETVDDDGVIHKEKVRRLKDGTVTKFVFDGSEIVEARIYTVRVKAVDKVRDLALLQIKGAVPTAVEAKLACKAPVRGEKVWLVGNPAMNYGSVETGIVSNTRRDYEQLKFGEDEQKHQPLMQISAGTVGGNSGGAVYNADGKLIGVPVIAHRTNEVLGWAVPLDEIKTFLKDKKIDGVVDAACR